jgi:hypothetical protein
MHRFLSGILYYYNFRDENKHLFRNEELSFTSTEAKVIAKKVIWSRINDNNQTHKMNIEKSLLDFYESKSGNLSSEPLSTDAKFNSNKFLIEFTNAESL